jgi:hypothetical protein
MGVAEPEPAMIARPMTLGNMGEIGRKDIRAG